MIMMGISPAVDEDKASAAASKNSSHKPTEVQDCRDGCQPFKFLTINQGIMITLQRPHYHHHHHHNHHHGSAATIPYHHSAHDVKIYDAAGNSNNRNASLNDYKNSTLRPSESSSNHHPTTSNSTTTSYRLEIHPQKDANLIEFHPNIYIPEVLLEYPDHLIKFGGGGSGVTVFGGYHPLLGSLVMKHGGHSDLIELVSLAKIEREMDVRSKWKIDRLRLGWEKQQEQQQRQQQQQQQQRNQQQKASRMTQLGSMFSYAHFLKPSASLMSSSTHHSISSTSSYHQQSQNDKMTQKKNSGNTKLQSLVAAHFLKPSSSSSSSISSRPRDKDDSKKSSQAQVNDCLQQQERHTKDEIQAIHRAVEDMIRRTPSFRMIYISPMHVRERAEELKYRSFTSSSAMMKSMSSPGQPSMDLQQWREKLLLSSSKLSTVPEKKMVDGANATTTVLKRRGTDDSKSLRDNLSSSSLPGIGSKLAGSSSSFPSSRIGRELHLFGSPLTKNSSIHVEHDHVDLCFGGNYHCWEEECQSVTEENIQQKHTIGSDGADGYASLMAFVDHLRQQQELNEWKITLAQEKIGISNSSDEMSQSSSKTASYLLAKGMLHGPLLHHLIDSEIQVIRNLQLLTMPEELNAIDKVRSEYEDIIAFQQKEKCLVSAANVSKLANNFVGRAIHKNFDPVKGRFVMLRQFGIDLRNNDIHLNPREVVPAKHLENLFGHLHLEQSSGSSVDNFDVCGSKGSRVISAHELMDSTFDMHYKYSDHLLGNRSTSSSQRSHPIFASGLDQWQSLLELSISMKHPNATQRIWTCGLTDGGLHNMFLSEDYMWLFDLGEPTLEPIPAFLTKFLMSFFHTLGMEEDDKGDWIVRFEQDDSGKLRLTKETMDILPTIISAFNTTLDRLINELFGGEEEIRGLLLNYVVTQLISDCAFCIEKWRIKGGGDELRSDHQENLEKWLWRALWDVYISEEIRRRYLSRMLLRRQFESRDLSSMDLDA